MESFEESTGVQLGKLADEIQRLAKERIESDLNRLTKWVNTNSGTENHEGNRIMLDYLFAAFRDLPGKGKIVDACEPQEVSGKGLPKCYTHVCRPDAPIRILLNGHVDTVFSKDHLFQHIEELDNERLKGPGITDMKGGLVIMLAALEIFETLGNVEQVGWEVLITCDEEIGSQNSKKRLIDAAQRNQFGITFESSLPDEKLVRKRMGVGTYSISVQGTPAHVGRNFNEGRNAIVKIGQWIQALHSLNQSVDGVIVNAGVVSGGGPLNVVSEHADAKFNIRVEDAVAAKTLFAQFERIHQEQMEEGYVLNASGQLNRNAKEAGPAFDALFGAWSAAAGLLGKELAWRDTGGGSDGNILQSAGLPIIDNLGAVGDGIHSSNEFILTKSLTDRTVLVATFLCMLSTGEFDVEGIAFGEHVKKLQIGN